MGVYSPQYNPGRTLLVIALIVFFSGLGGLLINKLITVLGLAVWFHYTAILSYLQYKRGSRHEVKGITGLLLKPQFRFFFFELLALGGILAVIIYGWTYLGTIVLAAWFVFSLNFYLYYSSKK